MFSMEYFRTYSDISDFFKHLCATNQFAEAYLVLRKRTTETFLTQEIVEKNSGKLAGDRLRKYETYWRVSALELLTYISRFSGTDLRKDLIKAIKSGQITMNAVMMYCFVARDPHPAVRLVCADLANDVATIDWFVTRYWFGGNTAKLRNLWMNWCRPSRAAINNYISCRNQHAVYVLSQILNEYRD